MAARLKEDASACIGMATRLRPVRLKYVKHVETTHFALQHGVREGRLTRRRRQSTRASSQRPRKLKYTGQTSGGMDHHDDMGRRLSHGKMLKEADGCCEERIMDVTKTRMEKVYLSPNKRKAHTTRNGRSLAHLKEHETREIIVHDKDQ